jgi:hypothetical protein
VTTQVAGKGEAALMSRPVRAFNFACTQARTVSFDVGDHDRGLGVAGRGEVVLLAPAEGVQAAGGIWAGTSTQSDLSEGPAPHGATRGRPADGPAPEEAQTHTARPRAGSLHADRAQLVCSIR